MTMKISKLRKRLNNPFYVKKLQNQLFADLFFCPLPYEKELNKARRRWFFVSNVLWVLNDNKKNK